MTRTRLLLLIPVVCVPCLSWSDAVDEAVDRLMKDRGVPGVSLALVHKGKVVKHKAYGLANVEMAVPATTDTLFQLASTTKIFSGVAVMQLVEQGKIKLSDPIGDHLSELPESWRSIPVYRLLNHTSGLPDYIDQGGGKPVTALAVDYPGMLKALKDKPFDFPTGTSWRYNQTNYALLAELLRIKSGKGIAELYTSVFFKPLGMTGSIFGNSTDVVPGRAGFYSRASRFAPLKHRGYDFVPFAYTAAGLNTTTGDLIKWDAAVRDGKLLKPETFAQVWTTAKLENGDPFHFPNSKEGYGLGWTVSDTPGNKAVGHTGGNATGFRRYLDKDLTVILLTNSGNANPESFMDAIVAAFEGKA